MIDLRQILQPGGPLPGIGMDGSTPLAPTAGTAATPFVWGDAGSRLTPEDIARKRQIAQALLQGGMDYSPVQSWAQGLARVAQGIEGAIDDKKLDKATAANAAADQSLVAQLLTPGAGGAAGGSPSAGGGRAVSSTGLLSLLANPAVGAGPKSIAKMLFEQQNKNPQQPPEIVQLQQIADDPSQPPTIREAARAQVAVKNNPVVTLPGGGLGMYSTVAAATQAQAGPPAEAVSALLRGEGTDAQFDQFYGVGAAAKARGGAGMTPDQGGAALSGASSAGFMSPAQASQVRASFGPKGQAAFDAWVAKNNIRIAQ